MKLISKKIIVAFIFMFALLLVMPEVMAETNVDYEHLCNDAGIKNTMYILGYILLVIKIIVPLLIIAMGMIEFGKSVLSGDDSALKKSFAAFLRKLVAGLIVFFIPTIVLAILNVIEVTGNLENSSKFIACTRCLLDPMGSCD